MEHLGFKFDEKLYSVSDDNIVANIMNDDGKSESKEILLKKGNKYYYTPTYIDKENNIKYLKKFYDFGIAISESSMNYFSTEICKKSLTESKMLESICNVVKRFLNKNKIVIDVNKKKSLNGNSITLNEEFIKDVKILDREIQNLDNIFSSMKVSKTNEYLFKKKYIKSLKTHKALYQSNVLSDLLNSTVLAYSDDTIIKKLSNHDIESLKKTISKLSSVLDFRYIKNIKEKELLKESIAVGEKILSIKNESSQKTILNIYTTYLKQKQFDKYFKPSEKNNLEKLWEAYITKYSSLILDVDRSNINNQFEIKRKNRKYVPDFVLSDLYGTKTIIEIKTHIPQVVNYDKSHDCLYFSSACNKAIGQLQSYIKKSVLSENDDKEYFSSAKGMIIIGNRHFDQQKNIKDLNIPSSEDSVEYYYKSLRDLNSVLINIELIYFDDLIDSMKKRLNRFL